MECLIAAMVLMVGGTILIVTVAALSGANVPFNSGYREVARHLRGRFQSGGSFAFPSVMFRHGEFIGELSVVRADGAKHTQIAIGPPSTAVEWELTEGATPFLTRRSGGVDIQLDDPRLRSRLRARAWNEKVFRQSMSEGTCWQLARLISIQSNLPTSVLKFSTRLAVRKRGTPTDWRQLMDLIRITCEIFDHVQLSANDSIEFVEGIDATLLEDVICPICGEVIQQDLVYCGGCKTPHHRDCWEYNGRCATYACGQERYLIPAVAKPLTTRVSETHLPDSDNAADG